MPQEFPADMKCAALAGQAGMKKLRVFSSCYADLSAGAPAAEARTRSAGCYLNRYVIRPRVRS